jgi:hypothetical protein
MKKDKLHLKATRELPEKFYHGQMDISEKDYLPREQYWDACNTLRGLIRDGKATRETILSELEDDL